MINELTTPRRQQILAGPDLRSSVEVDGQCARYEVRTANPRYQEQLEHMGYRRNANQFVRVLSPAGNAC